MSSCTQQAPAPSPLIPNTWPIKNSKYMNSNADLPGFAWWTQFKDPILNSLVDQALTHNNDLHIAMANIEAAQGELKQIQLHWIPEVTSNGGYSSFPNLGFPGVLLNVVPTYTLNLFQQIKEQQKARYELAATKALYQGVRLLVIGQITSTYIKYLSQIEQLALLQRLENDLSALIRIDQTMYQGGLSAKTNVDAAKSELALVKSQERVSLHNTVVSQNALHYLLDENPGVYPVTRQFKDLNGQQMIIGALPLTIIEHRPDLEQARQELYAANARIGITFSNLLPTVQLSLARGEIAKTANGFQLGQAIHFNQALTELPILKTSTYGELIKVKALNRASYYRYTNTLRKALQEVSNDLSAHDLYSQRLNDVLSAQSDLNHAYSLNKALYQKGIISHLKLIEEQIKLDELALAVNQYKLEQLLSIVTLYQNLAAGYDYAIVH